MQVSLLADRPELGDALIPDLLAEWRHILPEDTWDDRRQRFSRHANRDVLPIAWVAHDGEQALGTAALRVVDLPGYETFTPWLGGVFVRPGFRRRGIASALCAVVEAKARALRFEQLYLFTLDRQSLYARLGWTTFQSARWRDHHGHLMVKPLT